jgi:hypothetical protein
MSSIAWMTSRVMPRIALRIIVALFVSDVFISDAIGALNAIHPAAGVPAPGVSLAPASRRNNEKVQDAVHRQPPCKPSIHSFDVKLDGNRITITDTGLVHFAWQLTFYAIASLRLLTDLCNAQDMRVVQEILSEDADGEIDVLALLATFRRVDLGAKGYTFFDTRVKAEAAAGEATCAATGLAQDAQVDNENEVPDQPVPSPEIRTPDESPDHEYGTRISPSASLVTPEDDARSPPPADIQDDNSPPVEQPSQPVQPPRRTVSDSPENDEDDLDADVDLPQLDGNQNW